MKIVELNKKWNWIKEEGTYLSDFWFDFVYVFRNVFVRDFCKG